MGLPPRRRPDKADLCLSGSLQVGKVPPATSAEDLHLLLERPGIEVSRNPSVLNLQPPDVTRHSHFAVGTTLAALVRLRCTVICATQPLLASAYSGAVTDHINSALIGADQEHRHRPCGCRRPLLGAGTVAAAAAGGRRGRPSRRWCRRSSHIVMLCHHATCMHLLYLTPLRRPDIMW